MVLDVVRSDNEILDIIAITLASKLATDSKTRPGWIITAQCPTHKRTDDKKHESGRDQGLAWYKLEEGGRVNGHCCKQECIGPFKSKGWNIFDAVRQGIVIKTLGHQIIQK